MPTNAHLNSLGSGWECNPGFHVNNTGSICLSDKTNVYTQCPGNSFSCDGGCQNGGSKSTAQTSAGYVYAYGSSASKYQPILQAQTIIVTPVVYIVNGSGPATGIIIDGGKPQNNLNPPTDVPLAKTGSDLYFAFLIGGISLSIVVIIRKFAKKHYK